MYDVDQQTVAGKGLNSVKIPANTRSWTNVSLMLGQRRRRWTNIKLTMAERNVFSGEDVLPRYPFIMFT